ncbi:MULTISPECIES: right-handed parallel beta-helix repeat-containing protein [Streptacidiphilus]|uniref:Right-handed parallel beta-helix repeat-containing protein n=1 Tax=Streptacidiphilus cavernicola TaxID=3342716 RepID=A0ABV6UU46_9ACTN|nr:right-handed parallel beta-helix repeat-containing protein [Streptacidiphilus jeojiense]
MAALAATAVAAALLVAPAARASSVDDSGTLYVGMAHCSDTDPAAGSQAVPFCGVQAAADVVDPGQTILLEGPPSGTTYAPYYGPVTLSRSGTSAAPITVTAQPGAAIHGTLTLSGAHYVDVTGIDLFNSDAGDGITVSGSSNVVLDRDTVEMEKLLKDEGSGPLGQTGVSIDGGSSTVTVSRSEIDASFGYGIQVGAGASGVTLTTNALYGADAGGVEAEGVPDLKVTSNTVYQSCGAAIALLDGTSASVENNVGGWFSCTADPGYTHPPTGPSLLVDAASAAGVTSDYNAFTNSSAGIAPYSWAGVQYSTVSGLVAGTGQGAHDIYGALGDTGLGLTASSPLIDSADSGAAGELAGDSRGNPRVDDPKVGNTGTGANAYYDRGAFELEDSFRYVPNGDYPALTGVATVPLDVEPGTAPNSLWGEKLTTTADFGDGSATQTVPAGTSIMHTYQQPGTYAGRITITNADGYSETRAESVTVLPVTAPVTITAVPQLNSASGSGTVLFSVGGLTGAPLSNNWVIETGDGGSVQSNQVGGAYYTYTRPGSYTATISGTDAHGRSITGSGKVVVGDEYQPLAGGPKRDYDSRTHGRDSVPAHGWISVAVSSLHVPLYTQDAVLLNVTVTDPEAAGYVTVYQDHTAMPGTSNVNFAAGETVANQVTVTDGQLYVDFYNGSSKPIDLVVDTVGTFSNNARGLLYHPVGPVRVLDTRTGKQVAGRGTTSVKLAGTHGIPSNASAVVLNVTAADARSAGFLTAFGTGQPLPGVSNSNWSTGQVVPALVTVPLTNGAVSLHNGGAGAVDFIADLVGYYDSSSTGAVFIHNAPVRLLDTRSGTGAPKQQLGAGQTLRLRIGTAVAAALNLTVTGSRGGGYLTAFPDGTSLPTSSDLNYTAGQTVANMTVTPVGPDGYVDIHNGGGTPVSVMADLSGTYYSYG